MESTVLNVNNLKVGFWSDKELFYAVQDVSFSLQRGKTLGIVGESGCGKSVTCLSMLKLLSERNTKIDDESSVKIHDRELTEVSKKEMCRIRGNEIAMIFQDSMTSLNPVMTIEKQMMEPFIIHQNMKKKQARQKALEMLKKVGIPSPEAKMKQYPHQLSGGQRQRIMIAMALSCKPSLLICDEPTTALDVTIQAQILKLINRLKYEMNSSVLLITHDMGVISEMADNVIVMYAGKIVEYTSVNDLFKNPLHPYTVGLMKSIPDIDSDSEEELEVIPGSVPMLYELPEGCFFAPRCKYAKDLCHKKCPAMIDADNGHLVRCWKYHEEWKKEDK
mgnify:CR=1 FL=1